MTAAILTILAALIPFAIWLYRQSAARRSDPLEQNRNRYEQIDDDLAKGNGLQAGLHGAADLDEFERLQNARQGNQRGSDVTPCQPGNDPHGTR